MEGWETKSLGQVCGFVRGPFGGSLKKTCFSPTGYAVYEQQHAIYDQFEEVRYFIDEQKFNEMKRFEISPGDLIMSCSGTMGKVAIVPDWIKRGIINQALLKLTPSKAIEVTFLKYWMGSPNFQEELERLSQGVAIKNVASVKVLKEIPLLVPPLPEQRRIVAILDEAFAAIDQARANAERNKANARELFDSYVNAIFAYRGEGWVDTTIGEICNGVSTGPFGSMLHKSDYVEDGVPIVNPINIVGNKIVLDSNKTISSETAQRLRSYRLSLNDIVIGRRGEIGRCSVVDVEQDGWICGTGCFFVKPSDKINPYFLAHLIRSEYYRERLEHVATGATMKNLSNTSLQQFAITVPANSALQNEIVASIAIMDTEAMALENIYQRKVDTLDELKQSLLHQAFRGQLSQSSVEVLEAMAI